MKKILLLSLFCIIFTETKIGWVEVEHIANQLEDFRLAQVEIEKTQRSWESELNNMKSQLETMYQEYQQQSILMSEEKRKESEAQMMQYQQQIEMFNMQKFGPEGEIYTIVAQLQNPIIQRIRDAIEKVGNEQGYDYILDSQRGGILHALDAHNLNQLVLEELKTDSQE